MVAIERIDKPAKYPLAAGARHGHGYSLKNGSNVLTLLIHSTNNPRGDTSFDGEVDYLLHAPDAGTNYLVGADRIVSFGDDTRYAFWHSGDCKDNRFENQHAIGIETHYSPAGRNPRLADVQRNLTALVQHLLETYPHIRSTDIDTHRRQAIPSGRKSDPNYWSDTQFDAWREQLFASVTFDVMPVQQYRFVGVAPIRTGPSRADKLAYHITVHDPNGPDIVSGVADAGCVVWGRMVQGQMINYNSDWLWITNKDGDLNMGLGFTHASNVRRVV
jgi:hypothetical protein